MAPNPNASNPAFYHVQGWVKGIRHQLPDAGHWNVLQIKHMKNFKESRVFHEFLIVKVQRGDDASTTVELIVERKRELDQVVVGWNSKVAKDDYSRADVLSVLEFKETPPLLLLADVVLQTHKNYPSYHLFVANCFYFAHTVYKALQLQFANTEVNTQYHEYKGKFAGVRWVKVSASYIFALSLWISQINCHLRQEHHAKPVRIVPDGPEVTFSEDDVRLLEFSYYNCDNHKAHENRKSCSHVSGKEPRSCSTELCKAPLASWTLQPIMKSKNRKTQITSLSVVSLISAAFTSPTTPHTGTSGRALPIHQRSQRKSR